MAKLKLELHERRWHLDPGALLPFVQSYTENLADLGHTPWTVRGYSYSIRHFAAWLCQSDVALVDVDDNVVERFARHRCQCPGNRRSAYRSASYVNRVRRFVRFLAEAGVVRVPAPQVAEAIDARRTQYLEWLRLHRGLSDRTIDYHRHMLMGLLSALGDDPAAYDASLVQQIILEKSRKTSRTYIKKMAAVLRCYLRFLEARGDCRPWLSQAVPTMAEWRLSALPRYLPLGKVEILTASCDLATPTGIRDHAILLLLARLGLRAGDVIDMRLDDVEWDEGTLRVRGKGRREVRLPLPQDVGDALLNYLNGARPSVACERIFLRSLAPYRPFAASGSISCLVSRALTRAGITDAPSQGAHQLRHSAATAMLRAGATLDTIGTVLRHRSTDTTAHYAKVDILALHQIRPTVARRCVMLSRDMERYVELKRAAGFKFNDQNNVLKSFVAFATASGDEFVRIDRVLGWAALASSPQRRRTLMLTVRRFALTLQAEDSRHEVPSADSLGRAKVERRAPYIYTADEICRLMQAAARMQPQGSITPVMYATLFGLLAATGLRISEALALQYEDVTEDGLIIRQTKLKKSRLVPLHDTTRKALDAYLSVRKRHGSFDGSLFVSTSGRALAYDTVFVNFRRLTRSIGLRGEPGPRIHDLRHTFAVRSLERCGHDRDVVARHIVALSTYLGHARVTDTYWYLEATPIVMRQIAEAGETSYRRGAP